MLKKINCIMEIGILCIEPAHSEPKRIETKRDKEVKRIELFSKKPIRCLCSGSVDYLAAYFNSRRLKAKYDRMMLDLEERVPIVYKSLNAIDLFKSH